MRKLCVALAKPMFVNYTNNAAQGVFQRNTNCWAHGIDLSCASLWHVEGPPQEIQGRERYKQPITLISPRHAIGAWHARPGIGWHYVFQATDGTTVTNKVIGRTQTSHLTGDICVCLLEDEMPPSFVQAKILPSDYADYIGSGRPAFLVIDSEVVLLCCWWYGGPGDGPALHHYASHIQAAMDSLCPGYSLEFFDLSRYCPLLGETVP